MENDSSIVGLFHSTPFCGMANNYRPDEVQYGYHYSGCKHLRPDPDSAISGNILLSPQVHQSLNFQWAWCNRVRIVLRSTPKLQEARRFGLLGKEGNR